MNHSETEKTALYQVAAALMGLLALTVGLSFVNLGPFNMAAALTIAIAKALLVVTYFMELRRSSRLLWVMAAAGVLWLLILIGGTLADVVTRSLPGGLSF
jgi:cytochrome c oxidase subunit 4